jgi:3-methyladenine DNA glycosylase AlkD
MPTTSQDILAALQLLAQAEKRAILASFFKTGPGEYGEGDQFLGVSVPDQRKVVQAHWRDASPEALAQLLLSPWHEARHTAALMLVKHFEMAKNEEARSFWAEFYWNHRAGINNWDLVDNTAHKILGPWYMDKDRSPLHRMTASADLWEVRIGVLSTFHFIRQGQFEDTLQMVERLLGHPHDLIHKACGWMLREIGKRNQKILEQFLKLHYLNMPRTMLRYAIEKFEEGARQDFLRGSV